MVNKNDQSEIDHLRYALKKYRSFGMELAQLATTAIAHGEEIDLGNVINELERLDEIAQEFL